MRESGYYPPGAEFDSSAPYNQVDYPEVNFNCRVSYTLERDSSLKTDEVFWYDSTGDPKDACWEVLAGADLFGAYEYDRVSIPNLLAELVKYIDKELDITTDRSRKRELTNMRESAEGWEVVEQDIEII